MKIKEGFMLRNVAGQNIVVPVGNTSDSFNAMITLNGTGAFLWNALCTDTTVEKITRSLCGEYDVDPQTAANDVEKFINKLRENNLLSE